MGSSFSWSMKDLGAKDLTWMDHDLTNLDTVGLDMAQMEWTPMGGP
jgi:hypothetical protein